MFPSYPFCPEHAGVLKGKGGWIVVSTDIEAASNVDNRAVFGFLT